MAAASSYRELVVWQWSMELAEAVHKFGACLPYAERNRLIDQMSRASMSVALNIAEGSGRGSSKDYARFLSVARGSVAELETILLPTVRLGYATDGEIRSMLELTDGISRMLAGLRRHLLSDQKKAR